MFFQTRQISLHVKIGILLVVALLASLSFSSWFIYRDIRSYTYSQVADSLLKVASNGAMAIETLPGLGEGNIDPQSLSYAKTKSILNKIQQKNRFNLSEHLTRVSLYGMDPDTQKLKCLI